MNRVGATFQLDVPTCNSCWPSLNFHKSPWCCWGPVSLRLLSLNLLSLNLVSLNLVSLNLVRLNLVRLGANCPGVLASYPLKGHPNLA